MRDAENANSNSATIAEEVGVSDVADEETEIPVVSVTAPISEVTNPSLPISLPSPPTNESSSRLLEDIERALNTPPRSNQQTEWNPSS